MGLYDELRPGGPRSIDDDEVSSLIYTTLREKPEAATHWTCRSMADETGFSKSTVQRVWKAFGLQPHRQKHFKLSNDPFFVEKVRDIVGLYLNPPDNAMVLCVDEKSQIQALAEHSRSCLWGSAMSRVSPIATSETAQRHSLQPLRLPQARSWHSANQSTDIRSFCSFSSTSTRTFRKISTFISSSITTTPTNTRRSNGGWRQRRDTTSTTRQPMPPG